MHLSPDRIHLAAVYLNPGKVLRHHHSHCPALAGSGLMSGDPHQRCQQQLGTSEHSASNAVHPLTCLPIAAGLLPQLQCQGSAVQTGPGDPVGDWCHGGAVRAGPLEPVGDWYHGSAVRTGPTEPVGDWCHSLLAQPLVQTTVLGDVQQLQEQLCWGHRCKHPRRAAGTQTCGT